VENNALSHNSSAQRDRSSLNTLINNAQNKKGKGIAISKITSPPLFSSPSMVDWKKEGYIKLLLLSSFLVF